MTIQRLRPAPRLALAGVLASAALAHGVSVVTNLGFLSEPVWVEHDAVALAETTDTGELADVAVRVVGDAEARRDLARAGRDLYESRFAIGKTVATLHARPSSVRAAEPAIR